MDASSLSPEEPRLYGAGSTANEAEEMLPIEGDPRIVARSETVEAALRVGVVDRAGLGCPSIVDEEKDEERDPIRSDPMVEIALTLLGVMDRAGPWPSLLGVFVRLG